MLRKKSDTKSQKVIFNHRLWASLLSATFADMQAEDSSLKLTDLYEWIDRGLLELADFHVDTRRTQHVVTFAHGTDLKWAVTKLSGPLERISFRKPRKSDLTLEEESYQLSPAGIEFHKELFA